MSDIKVGDAVRTPRGSVARVCAIEQNGVAVLEQLDLSAAEGALYKSKLTRLVPDTGLAERVRKLADRFNADPDLPLGIGEELRELLDAEPAEESVSNSLSPVVIEGEGWRCTECGIVYPDEMDPTIDEECTCECNAPVSSLERVVFGAQAKPQPSAQVTRKELEASAHLAALEEEVLTVIRAAFDAGCRVRAQEEGE